MAVIAKDTGGGDFAPIPEGTYMGRCVQFVELGHLYNPTFGSVAHKILLTFEILDDTVRFKDKEGELVYPLISKEFTLSLSSKSSLRPMLESWRGKTFTPEELKGFDVTKVVGAPCMLSVVHKESGERTYANIASVMKPPAAMIVPEASRAPLVYEVAMRETGTWEFLPEWITKKIKDSQEFTAKPGQKVEKPNGEIVNQHPLVANPDLVNDPNSEYYVPPSDMPF